MGVFEKKLAKLGFAVSLVLLMALSPAFPQDGKPFKPNLSLKLSGGWGSALPKDDIDRQMESDNGCAAYSPIITEGTLICEKKEIGIDETQGFSNHYHRGNGLLNPRSALHKTAASHVFI